MLLMFLTSFCLVGQTDVDLSNIQGVEIFLFETECRNQNSYHKKYTTTSEQVAFMKKYKKIDSIPAGECLSYLDFDNCKTEPSPFLNKGDIERFNWESSTIYLTESGKEKTNAVNAPINGLAFVIKLNGINVYGGWLWNIESSQGCDRVYVRPNGSLLALKFGNCGLDPRKDKKRILKAIKNKE